MTRKSLFLAALAVAWLAFPALVPADVLLIDEVRQADNMDVPTNGMTTADVRARFGQPGKTHQPVGDPPITRWDYGQWSVYFEYDRVLFTVIDKDTVKKKQAD